MVDVDEKAFLGEIARSLGALDVHGSAQLGRRVFRVVGLWRGDPAPIGLAICSVATCAGLGLACRRDLESACHDDGFWRRYVSE